MNTAKLNDIINTLSVALEKDMDNRKMVQTLSCSVFDALEDLRELAESEVGAVATVAHRELDSGDIILDVSWHGPILEDGVKLYTRPDPQSGWLPIESAPTGEGGRAFLTDGKTIIVAFWGYSLFGKGGWCGVSSREQISITPTHWHPFWPTAQVPYVAPENK